MKLQAAPGQDLLAGIWDITQHSQKSLQLQNIRNACRGSGNTLVGQIDFAQPQQEGTCAHSWIPLWLSQALSAVTEACEVCAFYSALHSS